jgi:hypothetical protein
MDNLKYLFHLLIIWMLPVVIIASDKDLSTLKKEEPLTKEKSLAVFINYGNGYLDLGRANSSKIFEGEFVYKDPRPDVRYEIVGDEGRLDIEFSGRVTHEEDDEDQKTIRSFNKLYENEMLLNFNDDVPLTLDLELGVIKGDMDLSGLNIKEIDMEIGVSQATIHFDEPNPSLMESFSIEGGVGKLSLENLGNARIRDFHFEGGVGSYEIDFSGEYTHDVKADIEMGMGKMKLYLPKDIGTRIHIDKSFLSSFSIDEVYKRGDIYYNDSWDKTKYRLDLFVDTGVGKIEVVWID